jgi:hypothetical protein
MPSLATVLDACTDDTLLAIATSLTTAADLLRLVLISRAAAQRFYFNTTSYSGSSVALGGGGVPSSNIVSAADTWSIVEEVARLWLSKCTEQERDWVPRRGRESWLQLLREVELLRRAAVFRSSGRSIIVSAGGAVASVMAEFWGNAEADERDYDTAGGGTSLSTVVMRAGRHYAQFTVADPEDSTFGVMRPGWVRNATPRRDEVYNVGGHCFYEAESGDGWPSDAESNPVHDWEGAEEASEGDRIGLLLDLDHGSMNVYKNDELLGVMCESGLGGEYCWAAQVQGEIGASVRIDPAMVPA